VAVTAEQASALGRYLELLERWSARMNLTALTEPDEAVDRLVVEALAAVRFVPPGDGTVLDVGSGNGSPAVPFLVARPELTVWMIESKVRKAAFLREVVRTLGLSGGRVETARLEDLLPRADLHEVADVVTVRAVRVEPRQLVAMQAFIRPGGLLFWFRSDAGKDLPFPLLPPWTQAGSHALVDPLGSRLVVLRCGPVGETLRACDVFGFESRGDPPTNRSE
jgi:16S rRNA (guanine527-N7)-methyltransferase